MKIEILQTQSKARLRKASSGFTLVETIVAIMVSAIMLSAHFLAFAAGYALMTVTREDLRASQIMLQRMEAVRLTGYNQLADTNKFPASTTQYFDEIGKANGNGGVAYTVTHQIALPTANLPPEYKSNMTEVTVGVSWTSGTKTRTRSMKTYVAKYGVQGYIAGN
jgi:prepilin-type N-terminal cleavage/methylation domain-containing protein